MAREIKFRARDGVNNMWLDFDEYMIYLKIDGIRGVSCCEMVSPRRDAVIEQYTGLKDKNGVEIYDGDILKRHNNREFGIDVYIGEVIYVNNWARFVLYIHDGLEFNLYKSDVVEYEVIGNIHENPELLEE